jgi:hypothetical protein
MDVETKKDVKGWQNDLDGLADIHARLSTCESVDGNLARRITALEERNRGHYNADDPMAQMKGLLGGGGDSMLTYAIVIGVVMIVVEVIRQWPSLSSSAS